MELCEDLKAWIPFRKERRKRLSECGIRISIKIAQTHGSRFWKLKFMLYRLFFMSMAQPF